jgi:hypothetical protein
MKTHDRLKISAALAVLSLALTVEGNAQDASQTDGINTGNYNVRQSIEMGYRNANIDGNVNNYNTFVGLQTGVRLLDQSLDVRSLNHHGPFFDNLSLYNFGYGGDPNNLTRLRVSKNKWYDFRGTFRRDNYPWNYNLLANPLNPISSVPAVPITNSLHSMSLVRRMTDLSLTLLPQSRVQIRLGYTRNIQEGPSESSFGGATILDPPTGFGTQTQIFQNWKTTLNAYQIGADVQVLHKTTIHYDQFLQYFRQDTSYLNRNFNFQLSNGVPVDLGVVFDTIVNGVPCPTPIANPATTPPTADPSCNGYLGYSRTGTPRNFLPTEQFSFQSESIKNVNMTGRAAYSSGQQTSSNLNELFSGSNVSTLQVATSATGPTQAKRVITNVDFAGTWNITPKLRLVDSFTFDHFQIPGFWDLTTISLYAQAPLINGGPNLLLPPGRFNPTDCPSPFSAPTCPQHNANSGPDFTNGTWTRFLAQKLIANGVQLEYDFSSKVGARVGYRYSNRKVFSQDTLFKANEVFFPGGDGGTPDNFFNAARGDCADPTACTLQPDGSLVFTGASGDTGHVFDASINSNSLLMGVWAHPTGKFRMSFDGELWWANSAFARIDPLQMQHYRIQASYAPAKWINLDTSFNILEQSNDTALVNATAHNRLYSFAATLVPNERFTFDLGYTYSDIFSQLIECWAYGTGIAPPVAPGTLPPGVITTPCPVPVNLQGSDLTAFGGPATYSTQTHFVYSDVRWKPVKRLTVVTGYAGSFANGNTLFLNPNAPVGPLVFAYQKPYAGFAVDLKKGVAFRTTWAYYGYNPRSISSPAGLAPIGSQDFNANNVTVALRYSF